MWCFCFKQKTAYEMRISDWSSDVCSSDLHEPVPCSAGEIKVAADGVARLPYSEALADTFDRVELWQDRGLDQLGAIEAVEEMPVRLLQLAVGQAQGLRPLLHLALEILRVLPHRRDHAVEGAGELADFIPAMAVRERAVASPRSEERRGGTECVSTCRSRWSPYPPTKKRHD